MATTAGILDIYNMALGFIGTRTIGSPNENTPEAIQCELFWDRARRAALRDYPYSFAKVRRKLALKTLPDEYKGDWKYCYGLPDKWLKIHSVRRYGTDSRAPGAAFELASSGGYMVLLTNVPAAVADCTIDAEDISTWDDLFILAMARKLACLIAVPLLKNNTSKIQELEQLYQMAVPKSTGQDASERLERPYRDSWLAAREAW